MGSCRGFKDECNTPQLLLVCRLQQLRLVTYGCSFTSGRVIKHALLFWTFLSLFCSCLTSALAPAPAHTIPPLPIPLADLPGWNVTLIDRSWYYYETKEGMGFFHTLFADVESRCTWSVIKSTIMLILTYYAQQLSVFSGFRMLSNWRALTTRFNQIWQQCKFATRIFEKSLYHVAALEHMVRMWWF